MNTAGELARLRRYSRHLLVPEIGLSGQERITAARVLCIGVGGLGTPLLSYLAAAGVGCLGIIDDDVVDLSNLQRQILYSQADIGRPKVDVAAERVQALNPHVQVEAFRLRCTAENAGELLKSYDLVVDGSDSFATRYLINDAAVLMRRPNIFASIYRFEAQITSFAPMGRPCYRCIYPSPPPVAARPSCGEGGVLGAVAGIAGSWQAAEVLKMLIGAGEGLMGRMLRIDVLHARQHEVRLASDPECLLCGDQPQIHHLDSQRYLSEEPLIETGLEIEARDVASLLERGTILLDLREAHEAVWGLLEGALHIPYSQLEARLCELDPRQSYIVACLLGVRSARAIYRLQDAGLQRLYHLRGGMLSYAKLQEEFDAF